MKKQTKFLAAGAVAAVLSGPAMADYDHIKNGDFSSNLTDWSSLNEGTKATISVDNGRACVKVNGSTPENWHIRLYQTGLTMDEVESYTLSFDAWSTKNFSFDVDISDPTDELYRSFVYEKVTVTSRLNDSATTFSKTFTPSTTVVSEYGNNTAEDGAGQLQFTLGAGALPIGETVCFDNVKLVELGGSAPPPPAPPEASVEVNQHGYSTELAKVATYQLYAGNNPSSARDWELVDRNGSVIETGTTSFVNFDLGGKKFFIDEEVKIIQVDRNSGELIHHIDFSNVNREGTGYKLRVKEGNTVIESYPFSIGTELMGQLKYDALSYFYHNRQGIEILSSLVDQPNQARGVGHPNDILIETFECIDNPQSNECYKLDGSKGWYDAGDHGKYVVNGGISAWTLMNQYERSKYLGRNMADFATNTMPLPVEETNNNLPDILDEVKWEMEFLLNMQVPDGKPYAGMAFHRMNNTSWTNLPTDPSEDPGVRYAHAPTTAATLNLAATAAQCARVFKPFDTDFAEQCLTAAKKALAAAKQYPERYAAYGWELEGKSDSFKAKVVLTDPANGGPNGAGLYNDLDVSDEFFWAYAELYATTKEDTYKNQLKNSAVYGKFSPGSSDVGKSLFTWQLTNMLGAASLATVGDLENLDSTIVNKQKALLKQGADSFVSFSNNPGYSTPADTAVADWGSNSNVLNNMVVLGLVNDLECEQGTDYINAIEKGMTYLLGNNPNNQSYVSGYGENALENPHHRFWAQQKDGNDVSPPPGAVSGGPNTTWKSTGNTWTGDKLAEACNAEACFVDNIDAWSVNEITVNWNSPFAWAVAYLDEYNQYGKATTQQCANRTITLGGTEETDNDNDNDNNNQTPVITTSITAPSTNTQYYVGDTAYISVSASSTVSDIEKVTFKIDGEQFQQDSTAPYAASWSASAVGSYQLTATVILKDGSEKTTNAVTLNVIGIDDNDDNNTGNEVTFNGGFTAPSNNSVFTEGTSITLKANAVATNATVIEVKFYQDGNVLLGQDTTAPYSYDWTPTPGSYSITAKATLSNGEIKTLSAISVTVNAAENDDAVINASFAAPSNNAEYELGTIVNLTVDASSSKNNIAKVLFYVNGGLLDESTDAAYQTSWSPQSVGSFTLSAKVVLTDNTEKMVSAVTVKIVEKQIDGTEPSPEVVVNASFENPIANSTYTVGDTVLIKVNASATNANIENIKFYVNNQYIGQKSTAPYSVNWVATTAGNHNISAKVNLNNNKTTAVDPVIIVVKAATQKPDENDNDDTNTGGNSGNSGNTNNGSSTGSQGGKVSIGATSPWLFALGLVMVLLRRRAR